MLPWFKLMAFGMGRMNLAPRDFWSMSLPEMDATIEGATGSAGREKYPSRNTFEAMIAEYPDR